MRQVKRRGIRPGRHDAKSHARTAREGSAAGRMKKMPAAIRLDLNQGWNRAVELMGIRANPRKRGEKSAAKTSRRW